MGPHDDSADGGSAEDCRCDLSDVWVITNDLLDDLIGEQLPEIPREQILSEPAARNTAPACALAAFLLEKNAPETVIGIFPSDHVVKDVSTVCRGDSRRCEAGGEWGKDCGAGCAADAGGDWVWVH